MNLKLRFLKSKFRYPPPDTLAQTTIENKDGWLTLGGGEGVREGFWQAMKLEP